jgi:broad specificity phosphatase PhoE
MNEEPNTLLGLMRHGQTLANQAKVIQGQTDSPLSPEGEAMAEKWGRVLAGWGWQRIVSSDLGRAVNTARIVNQCLGDLPHELDHRLREQNWGEWTGGKVEELRKTEPELERQEGLGWDFTPPGGESRKRILDRAKEALLDAAGRYPKERILVVSHFGILSCLTQYLMGYDFMPGSSYPLHGKGYRLHLLNSDGKDLGIKELNREFEPA